jgi:hypothetical protein
MDNYTVSDVPSIFGFKVIDMPVKWFPPNLDDLLRRYRSGMSVNQISRHFGVARLAVNRVLRENGITPRGQSEAETLKWGRMGKHARMRQTKAAHDAVRGKPRPIHAKIKLAESVAANPVRNIGRGERELQRMLETRGLIVTPQQAVGPYNCDIGIFPVAVEVFGGHWHWSGRHLARTEERFRHFFNAGWSLFVVRISKTEPLIQRTADEIVSYFETVSGNPSRVREYRVIGGTGKFIAGGCATDDKISLEPATTNSRDPATGRYKSVPRKALRM